MPATTLLMQGSKGMQVVELKRLLNIWGETHPLPQPATTIFDTDEFR